MTNPQPHEMTMVERVRDAIHGVLVKNGCDTAVCKFAQGCGCAEDGAGAAILAMREPTQAMLDDGCAVGSAWRAMIDAALAEKE